MNTVSLERIIELVSNAVVRELHKQGVQVVSGKPGIVPPERSPGGISVKTQKIDMSAYKTPVLTEQHLSRLHELTGTIIVPRGTVITPKAREAIKAKSICVTFE